MSYSRAPTKMTIVENLIKQLSNTIQTANDKGSDIDLHVIKFNTESRTYSKHKNESTDTFINRINFYPHDLTDFISASDTYNRLRENLDNNIVSLFLSDGFDNINRVRQLKKQYDYALGIGTDFTVDEEVLAKISNKYYISNKKNEIEDIIIDNIFTDVNLCNKNVNISITVPVTCKLLSDNLSYFYTNNLPTHAKGQMPFLINFYKNTKNDNNILTINPVIEHERVEKLNVVFVVDESGSMADEMCEDIEYELPSPHINVENIEHNTSVFDSEEIKNNDYKYITYTFNTIEHMNKYYQFNAVLQNCDKIVVQITTEDKSFCRHLKRTSPIKTILYDEIAKLEMAINKITNMEKNGKRRDYILELYNYIDNEDYKDKIFTNVLLYHEQNSYENNKLEVLMAHIKSLYNSLLTLGDLGHKHYLNRGFNLERMVNKKICKSLSAPSIPSALDKDCMLCCDKPRSIVLNCGHMITCKDCILQFLFGEFVSESALHNEINDFDHKKCPMCREVITGYYEINNADNKCITKDCNMTPTIICCKCKEPIYCKCCWENKLQSKKRKRNLYCKCGHIFEKYVEALV